MAQQPLFGAQIEAALADITKAFAGDTSDTLATLSAATAYRARRLAASEQRLAKGLGADHPRVVALRARREHVEGVGRGIDVERERVADEQPLRPGEWLVTGRVLGADGGALEGFRVVVLDVDTGPDDPLGDELTDAAGEFRAEYHRRDFDDVRDTPERENERAEKERLRRGVDGGVVEQESPAVREVPSLSVLVFDRSGKLVFEADRPVRASSSRRDRFEILLSRERLDKGVDRRTCAGTTAAGEPCKNAARPGTEFCKVHTPE